MMNIDELRRVLKNSEVDVGIIFYGTPRVYEVECIMVRLGTNYLRIYDLVVKVGIFHNSLNADAV